MEQTYCIYKLTNIVNGKGYIGFTSDFKRRLREHKKTASKGQGQAIHAAIRKHGWENFVAEELYYSYDKQHTLEIEDVFIKLHETKGLKGYNITRGGQSGFSKEKTDRLQHSEATRLGMSNPLIRQKMSMALTGRHISDSTKQKLSIAAKKRKASDQTKQKMSLSQTGKRLSEIHKCKISAANSGKRAKECTRQLLSRIHKKFTINQAIDIRNRVASGEQQKIIAQEYGVAPSTIHVIVHQKHGY